MPILPLDYPEPFASTLGVMLYPATEEATKARAFAAQFLVGPIRRLREAGHRLSYEALKRIVMDAGQRLTDRDVRWRGGSATGETFKTLFALANTDPVLASWSNAITIAEKAAARHSGARTSLYEARRRFWSVAHLWGAWSMREGMDKPIHSLLWYLSRATLDALADHANAPRVDELRYQPGVAVNDEDDRQCRRRGWPHASTWPRSDLFVCALLLHLRFFAVFCYKQITFSARCRPSTRVKRS
jgi:hypothetical protein